MVLCPHESSNGNLKTCPIHTAKTSDKGLVSDSRERGSLRRSHLTAFGNYWAGANAGGGGFNTSCLPKTIKSNLSRTSCRFCVVWTSGWRRGTTFIGAWQTWWIILMPNGLNVWLDGAPSLLTLRTFASALYSLIHFLFLAKASGRR